MDILFHVAWVMFLIIVAFFLVLRQRKRLLKLWKEVSVKEVVFHKLLMETTNLVYNERQTLKTEENAVLFRKLSRLRKKKMRYLLLKERQDLFMSLHHLLSDMEDLNLELYETLKKQFKKLQQARRVYNSKVLMYNQQINIFPNRLLAIKMNLKAKEYFG